jgi:predicted PurR-regulated permease PerM
MNTWKERNGLQQWLNFSMAVLSTSLILYFGKTLFIPLGFALFISIILYPSCSYLESKGMPRGLAISMGLIMILLFVVLMGMIFGAQLKAILAEWPMIQTKLGELFIAIEHYLVKRYGVSDEQVVAWMEEIVHNVLGSSVGLFRNSLNAIAVNLVIAALVPVYAFLILLYRRRLASLVLMLMTPVQRQSMSEVMHLSIRTYFRFIKGMGIVYAIVGTLNSIGLWLLGIPHPFLFGYLTAVMTFIPYVGIMLASILPITYAWVTYASIFYPLGVVAIFTFVQYLEANVIFPWAVGQRLELNTLSTLIVIVTGGIIWGGAGMILFIPFAAILKLIADRMPGWEAVAVFLGNKEETERENTSAS